MRPVATPTEDPARDWRIGIDLGGTKIAAGLVDVATGTLLHPTRRSTPVEDGPDAVVNAVAETASGLLAIAMREGIAPASIGIAIPELVDHAGLVASSWNFAITDIAARVREAVSGLPTFALGDVQAAAHAEATFGAGRGLPSFAYVSLGTGMSYTFCLDGRPWTGANGFAIHFASSPTSVPRREDDGLDTAILEDFASGKGMARTYERRTGKPPADGARTLEALAQDGDPVATRVIDEASDVTGRLLAQIVNMLDPHGLVVGGGLGCSQGRFRAGFERRMRAEIWAERCRSLPLVAAGLGEAAGTIGAALAGPRLRLALERLA